MAKGTKHDDAADTADTGEKAFAALASEIAALKDAELASSSLDIAAAGLAAIGVAKRVDSVGLTPRLLAIPKAELDPAHVKRLSNLAWAAHYAGQKYNLLRGTESNAKITPALDAASSEVEGRLQKLTEYYFSDHPVYGPLLDTLRPGTSYRDRAGDLLGYVGIARDNLELVKHDKKHYRASDLVDAPRLANEIVEAIGSLETTEARTWGDHAARAFTLLQRSYVEVMAAGLFLERHDPDRFAHWPSLYVAGRPNVGRPRKAKPSGDTAGGGATGGGTAPTDPTAKS